MSTFGQIGAMLSRSGGKDRDINDMPERIKNMEGFIIKMREWLEPQDDAAILHWIELADGLVKTEREDGWEDDDCTAIIFDGQPGDACEMCGVLHTADEFVDNGGEALCSACAAEIRKK